MLWKKDKKHRSGAFIDIPQMAQTENDNQFLFKAFNNVFTNPPKNLGSLIV